ncbi:MAG: 2-oxoglutarate dehydrogenase E1 component [Proteobacteria bacterium]|nr:MAG: 2-oxoglutarate dehydrogenase E1 component [Pseudomonadota bacterium]
MTKKQSDPVPPDALSYLSGGNAAYLEDLYQQYLKEPDSIDPAWVKVFRQLGESPTALYTAQSRGAGTVFGSEQWTAGVAKRQSGVLRLINAYRTRGHQVAATDPLGLEEPEPLGDITLDANGLTASDLDTVFDTGSFAAADRLPLRDIISAMNDIYCGTVGAEYMYITKTEEKRWIQSRIETIPARRGLEAEVRRHILERLTAAEGIEKYLHTKYVGQKRFSLEGGESLIPMLSELIQRCGAKQVKEVVIGMAHRGRLNVLVNILGKSPKELFGEFEGKYSTDFTDIDTGDVKYHQGFSSDIMTPGGPVHLALSFNPSHLEIINPVVEGSVRARQHRRKDSARNSVVPILIHGDAAFAGQGVVMETLNMSQARGYSTGGTVHIIVNNQIGFTTSNRADARPTTYCSEVAKMVQAPIFHVNGDDPDAVHQITQIALDYRMTYHKDVVIDLVCYRRLGHNEADEPSVTQPIMYKVIKSHPTTRQIYAQKLVADGVIAEGDAEDMVRENRNALDAGRIVAGQIFDPNKVTTMVDWRPYIDAAWTEEADTRISVERIQDLNRRLTTFPEGFELHARVKKIVADRVKMAAGEVPMDWGFAETMAYAGLVEEGYTVRLSGQDSGRGTFFHRHATVLNQADGETFVPLRTIVDDPNRFLVINSLLSEEAVLGFEYGYATTDPDTLVVWEAQFGDFANGAQVVIDQFISSGEAKWRRLCGLVLMLPHGYEGQGPEHSSARLERFLQLCAEHNMQVCVPTTPAQMFHMLRRQMIRPLRRPLVVMSPKSLLRHKLSVSTLEDLSNGAFQTVIDEIQDIPRERVERVILCSGKIYYELHEERISREQFNSALVRVEQLHPFPKDRLSEVLAQYENASTVVWCQEEPKNQGSWYQIAHHLKDCLAPWQTRSYAGREASAAPAVGFHKLHLEQTQRLLEQAFTIGDDAANQSTEKKVASNAQ